MRVVDRDGLDGIFATAGEARAQVGARRPPRRESVSGLAALAEASRTDHVVDDAAVLGRWTELEPLALVATELPAEAPRGVHDTRVDDTMPTRLREWSGLPPTRIGRFARPTLKPPLGEKPVRRIVLSFVVGGAALCAAVILMAMQSTSLGDAEGGRAATRAERRVTSDAAKAAVASLGREASPSAGRGEPGRGAIGAAAVAASDAANVPEPRPVLAATIDDRALHRRPLVPPRAMLPGGRLEWRMPARFSFGGEAPDTADDEAIASLVSTLVERCEPGTLVVTGHTCNVGNELFNLVIGKRRALFARDLLVAAGLPARGLRVASAASLHPEVSNATPAGRVRNRRVTVACQPLRHERSTR